MRAALEALLLGVIDYAGLYPPAKLDMRQALREYLDHWENDRQNWIMDRFVCPAGALEELATEVDRLGRPVEFPVTVVGSPGESFSGAVFSDKVLIDAFNKRFPQSIGVEAYEIKAPPNIADALKPLETLGNVDVYVEVPLDPSLGENLDVLTQHGMFAAKARTGGLEPAAIPSSEALATFLRECYSFELEFKLTAGLHHPIRHFDASVGAKAHGFLNVLVASALLFEHDLATAEVQAILDDENPSNFRFTDETVARGDMEAGADAIEEMRCAFGSYGSCSILEPLHDLQELGLLEGAAR